MPRFLFAATFLVLGSRLCAAETCATLDNKATAALFDEWNFALSSLDATQVAQRYWPNAVLLPTQSNTPRTDAASISDYFVQFLAKRPRGRIDTRTIQSGCNLAMDVGTYTFSLMDDKGAVSEVSARYTLVYQYRDGAWKILHHHSSAMPEVSPSAVMFAEASTSEAPVAETPAATRKQRQQKRKEVPVRASAASLSSTRAVVTPAMLAKAVAEAKPVAMPAAEAKPVAETKPSSTGAKPSAADPGTPKDVKTAMFVNLTSSPPPSRFYPAEAARRKERGNVNLKVCADDAGALTERLEVLKSSGSTLLDEAAIAWAREATWVPATLNHRRVEGCTQVDVAFEENPAGVRAGR